jgi:hypothetical protein
MLKKGIAREGGAGTQPASLFRLSVRRQPEPVCGNAEGRCRRSKTRVAMEGTWNLSGCSTDGLRVRHTQHSQLSSAVYRSALGRSGGVVRSKSSLFFRT